VVPVQHVRRRTVYTASTRRCAFDEVLAGFRRRLGTRDFLATDAAAVGLSVAEFLQAVDADWAELGERLALGGIIDIDLALLHGPDRLATIEIATWVSSAILDDAPPRTASSTAAGTPAATCTPHWLRRLDTVDPVTEPLTADTGTPISARDADLHDTAPRFGLTVH
jgi:hypothetical protein